MTLEQTQKFVEELIDGPVEWDGDKGFFPCPLADLHTSPTKEGHTVCYLDGIPTLYCWHNSCAEWYLAANQCLRRACDTRTQEEKILGKTNQLAKRTAHYRAMEIKVKRDSIFEEYAWPELFANPLSAADSWSAFFGLWAPGDVIWIGEVYDTGGLKGVSHFKQASEWRPNNSQFTCASTFLPGTVDRTNKQVDKTKYLVVEFDSLDSDKQENRRKGAALLNYIRTELGLDFAMVVDSGNKSLHCWVVVNEKVTEEMRFILRQLGADINSMRPSQPIRLPGAIRDNGNVQSVLWVKGNNQ